MKQITDIVRIYASESDRRRAVQQLARHGYNYFVPFRDVQGVALQYGTANWVPAGQVHVDGGWNLSTFPECSRPWVHRP